MIRESLFFVDDGTGAARATLLFAGPERLSVMSATGDVAYEDGRDYTVDRSSGILTLIPGSRIACSTLPELYPADEPYVLIGDGADFHRRQIAATYTHPRSEWHGDVPRSPAIELRRSRERLAASQPLTLCITGDSISEGYNASAFTGAPPSPAAVR